VRRIVPKVAFLAVLAVALGMASAIPLDGWGGLRRAVLPSLFLFVAFVVFLLALRGRLGLPSQIFVAMVTGILCGWLFTHFRNEALVTDYLGIFGTLFILMLKLVIVPLIFVSIVCGVAGIGDVRKLGSLGAKTLGYYFLTTAIAVVIGLCLVNAIRPGSDRETLQRAYTDTASASDEDAELSIGMKIQKEFLPRIVRNPIMADENPLVIIFFALLLGAALASLGQDGLPALKVFRALDKALIQLVIWTMALAPLGVFALMSRAVVEMGMDCMATLAKYFGTVLLGLGIHFGVLVFVICPLLGRISPLRFLRGMLPALQVSFSTSSSSATLPVTIDCASRRVGSDENVCNFMLPLGATINMDGTALYLAVASLFMAQMHGMQLGLQEQVVVFLTAVLVSIGTAGIPSASLGLIPIILTSAGIPLEGLALVFGVDRFLDMSRTVVNITGDSVGTVVVSQSEGVMGEPVAEPEL